MEGLTSSQIRAEFRSYRMSLGQSLGQFLADYHSLWTTASQHGVSKIEGILHLLPLLPPEWQGWAVSLVPAYIGQADSGPVPSDVGGFIGILSHRFFAVGTPPLAPYPDLQSHAPDEIQPLSLPQYDFIPFMLQPFMPVPDLAPEPPSAYIASLDVESVILTPQPDIPTTDSEILALTYDSFPTQTSDSEILALTYDPFPIQTFDSEISALTFDPFLIPTSDSQFPALTYDPSSMLFSDSEFPALPFDPFTQPAIGTSYLESIHISEMSFQSDWIAYMDPCTTIDYGQSSHSSGRGQMIATGSDMEEAIIKYFVDI